MRNRKTCAHRSEDGKGCKAKPQKGLAWCYSHAPEGRVLVRCARVGPNDVQCGNAPIKGDKWCRSHHPERGVRKSKRAGSDTHVGPRRCSKCFQVFGRSAAHTASMLKSNAPLSHKTVALAQSDNYCDRCCVGLFPAVFKVPPMSAIA